jgi:hypothetical protein
MKTLVTIMVVILMSAINGNCTSRVVSDFDPYSGNGYMKIYDDDNKEVCRAVQIGNTTYVLDRNDLKKAREPIEYNSNLHALDFIKTEEDAKSFVNWILALCLILLFSASLLKIKDSIVKKNKDSKDSLEEDSRWLKSLNRITCKRCKSTIILNNSIVKGEHVKCWNCKTYVMIGG